MTARVSAFLRVVLVEHDVELSPVARHLAEVLGHYADTTATAWPSIAGLCRRTGYHPSTIRKARRELVNAGVIAFEERRGDPRDPESRNRYRFPVGMPLALSTDPRSERGCDAPDTRGQDSRHPRSDRVDTRGQTAGERSIEESIEAGTAHDGDEIPDWVAARWGYLMGNHAVGET
jgi:hypothetical protein